MRNMPQCTCKLPRGLIKYWEFLHWQSDLIRVSLASLSVSICTFNFLWDNATSMTKHQEIDRSGSKCPTCRRLTYLGFTVHTISKLQDMLTRATFGFHFETRMHSSKMRTGRSLTVCCSLLPGGLSGPGCMVRGEGCLVWGVGGPGLRVGGGCLPSGGRLSAPGGVCSQGGVCSRDVCSQGGCLLPGGIPACTEADTPPPLWTDTRLWKYYPGPTPLRPVNIYKCVSIGFLHGQLQFLPPYPSGGFLPKWQEYNPTCI